MSASTGWASGPGWRGTCGARPLAARRRPGRVRAEGRVRSGKATRIALEVRGDERLLDADGDPLDDGDRGRRDPIPAGVPGHMRRRRAAETRGDPVVSRAVRRHRARVLRPLRELPAVRQLPVHGGAGGSMGRPMPGWDVAILDEAGDRCPRASEARSASGRVRTRTTRSATGTTRGMRRRRSAATGSARRMPRAWTRTGTSGTRAGPTTSIISAGYRIGPFEVGVPRASSTRPSWRRRRSPARTAPRQRRQGVRRPRGRLRDRQSRPHRRSSSTCEQSSSAYHYPRLVEFVPSLPKTLTGKDPEDRTP